MDKNTYSPPSLIQRIFRWPSKLATRTRANLRFFINRNVHGTARIERKALVHLSPTAEIKEFVIIKAFDKPVIVGANTQINPFTVIYSHSEISIGDNVMIAPHCMIASGNHDFRQTEKPMRFAGNLTKGPIVIEDDVWIGANSVILDGVKIAKGAVIAAGTVVSKDVAAYSIVGGVPARQIGERKSER